MKKNLLAVSILLIAASCFFEISNLFANPLIVEMISATPTGRRREVTRSIHPIIWEYEIKVE